MNLSMSSTTRIAVAIAAVAVLAIAFWVAVLGPKRQDAADLGKKVDTLKAELSKAQQDAVAAADARKSFPQDYHQLVVLGKAVPAGDDTPSLLVDLSGIAKQTGVQFDDIALDDSSAGDSSTPAPTAPTSSSGATPVSATEASASLLPLGATVGAAGLGVMPYSLTFTGKYFQVANFIKGIDGMVHTKSAGVAVNGRLVTIDGFSLTSDSTNGGGALTATFSVTTFLTPPAQGTTAGATPTAPSSSTPAAVDTSQAVSTTP